MRVEGGEAVHGIDQRDHAVEPVAQDEIRMHHDGVQHRRRVGEPGGLDHDATERDAAIVEIAQELLERGHELAANRTA